MANNPFGVSIKALANNINLARPPRRPATACREGNCISGEVSSGLCIALLAALRIPLNKDYDSLLSANAVFTAARFSPTSRVFCSALRSLKSRCAFPSIPCVNASTRNS